MGHIQFKVELGNAREQVNATRFAWSHRNTDEELFVRGVPPTTKYPNDPFLYVKSASNTGSIELRFTVEEAKMVVALLQGEITNIEQRQAELRQG